MLSGCGYSVGGDKNTRHAHTRGGARRFVIGYYIFLSLSLSLRTILSAHSKPPLTHIQSSLSSF